MRRASLSLGLAFVLAGPLACEPATPPIAPTTPTPKPAATVAAPAEAAKPTYDLSPVAEPAELVGLMRWKSPGATFANLGTCMNFPSELVQQGLQDVMHRLFRKVLRGDSEHSKALADLVVLDAPLDFAVALDPQSIRAKPSIAFSVGLSSLERAKGALEGNSPLVELTPGVFRMGDKSRHDLHCVLAASAGATPARLVCGPREKGVTALAPYMVRTLPLAQPSANDFHAEMRFVPIDARYGQMLHQQLSALPMLAQTQATIGDPTFDQAVVDAANAISTEVSSVVSDLDMLTLDASMQPSTCLSTTGALQMRGRSSWMVNTMVDRADRAGAPPAIFWRLPKDSGAASFSRGGDPARYTEILRVLRALIDGGLAKLQVGSAADRKALVDLIQMPLSKDTNIVQASGHAPGTPTKLDPGTSEDQFVSAVLNSALGWHLVGFDEGPDALGKMLKNLVNVYNRKGLMAPLKKELGDDAKLLPAVRIVTAPAKLGRGALDIEIKVTLPEKKHFDDDDKRKKTAKKKAPPPLVFHLLMMPDGARTWLSWGSKRDELVERLLKVKSDVAESESLAARADLAPLKSAKLMSGGFMTMNLFTRTVANVLAMAPDAPAKAQDFEALLSSLPHKGNAPIFFSGKAAGGDKPRVALSLEASKPVFEDLGALVLGGIKLAGQSKAGGLKVGGP